MIKVLAKKDQKEIVDFCMKNERENLFVLGSFLLYKNGFKINRYIGHFEQGKLNGLAVYFGKHRSFVINSRSKKAINALVDFAQKSKMDIAAMPVFKKCGMHAMKRFKKKPSYVSYETIMILDKKNFKNRSSGLEEIAKKTDIDELAYIDRLLNHNDANPKISAAEKAKINPGITFVLRKNKKIISKAYLHGMSRNYFQIGGVLTMPEYRNKGYAKQVVSALCAHYFKNGFKYGLLFTLDENISARKVYDSLGFKPVDKFIIAEY